MTLIKQMVTKNIWTALMICSVLSILGGGQTAVAQNTFPNPGNVGIGTTSPGKLLTVNGDAGITTLYGNSTSQNANDSLRLGPGSNGNFFIDNIGAGGLAQTIIGFNTTKTAGTNGVFSIFNNSTDRNLLFMAQSAGTGSGSNQVIFPTGNVGIGTTSPGKKLEILATDGEAVRLYRNANNVGWGVNMKFAFNNGNNAQVDYAGVHGVTEATTAGAEQGQLWFTTATAGSLTPKMMINASGNVGIGTTNPSAPLTVGSQTNIGGTSYGLLVNSNLNASGALIGGLHYDRAIIVNPHQTAAANGNTVIHYIVPSVATGVTQATMYGLYVDAPQLEGTGSVTNYYSGVFQGGNVGIGTATPGYKLDVAGQIRSSTGGFMFPDGTLQLTASPGGTITGVTAGAGLTGGGTSGSITLTNNDTGSAQSIFKNIANAAGTTQFSAGSNSDSLRFEGTGGTTVSFTGGTTKKITIDSSAITSSQWTTSGSNINYATAGGNVGVGQPIPAYKLDVNGTAHVSGNLTVDGNLAAKYQDLAEWVPASEQLAAGTVVVLDPTKTNQVTSSTVSYDTRVAGVISAQPGIALGESGASKVLVATTGRVRVKVDATRAPIQVGDLLVTSDIPGVAMKSEPVSVGGIQLHRPGTLIGKALEPLAKGSGEILVLLSLQ